MPTEGLHGYPMPAEACMAIHAAEALRGYPMPAEALRGYPMPGRKPCVAILCWQKPCTFQVPNRFSAINRAGRLPVMLSELHGPRLLAFATSAGERGLQLFRDYIAIQASNQYPIYRDLSLYKLVPSIVRHPDDAAALRLFARAREGGAIRR